MVCIHVFITLDLDDEKNKKYWLCWDWNPAAKIIDTREKIEAFVGQLNAKMAAVFEEFTNADGETFDELVESHNNLCEDMSSIVERHTDEMEDYHGDRAEAWYDSEGCAEFDEWWEEWQAFQNDNETTLDAPALHQFQFELADELEVPPQARGE